MRPPSLAEFAREHRDGGDLDPAFALGTGTPVCGGLSSFHALEILRGLRGINVIDMDVVEVAPAYDHAEITSLAAALAK